MVRQFDEDAVLNEVLNVFWTQGWQATSMANLAEATQVQRGSLYHAYGSKEQLFALAFERYAVRVLEEVQHALDAPSAHLALHQFFDVLIADMTTDEPPRGCFTTRTALESEVIGPQMQGRVRMLVDRLEAVIAEALSRDTLRASLAVSPESAAQTAIVFTRGLAVMERLHHEPQRLRQMADQLLLLLLKPDAKV